MRPECFLLDVDGVMNTGQFLYCEQGKTHKIFGPDDADALKLLKPLLEIRFISADHRGYRISEKRIHKDMGYPLDLIPSAERLTWIKSHWNPKSLIYMGDGFWDYLIFKEVGYSITPQNAFFRTKECANYVTSHASGDRAVAEAVIHIAQTFFKEYELPQGLR